jgi:hypothetical protein
MIHSVELESIILLDAQFYRSNIDHKIRIGDTTVFLVEVPIYFVGVF